MKRSIVALLICSLLSAQAITLPPLNDDGVTYYDISSYSNNPALWDYSGKPYTRQFFFTLETSTNTVNWSPACTVTGWCNANNLLVACYTNGVLAASCYRSTPGSQWLAQCIVAAIVIGIGVFVAVELKKICDRCLPPPTTPSTPPPTNSSSINLPATTNKAGFYRIKQ